VLQRAVQSNVVRSKSFGLARCEALCASILGRITGPLSREARRVLWLRRAGAKNKPAGFGAGGLSPTGSITDKEPYGFRALLLRFELLDERSEVRRGGGRAGVVLGLKAFPNC